MNEPQVPQENLVQRIFSEQDIRLFPRVAALSALIAGADAIVHGFKPDGPVVNDYHIIVASGVMAGYTSRVKLGLFTAGLALTPEVYFLATTGDFAETAKRVLFKTGIYAFCLGMGYLAREYGEGRLRSGPSD